MSNFEFYLKNKDAIMRVSKMVDNIDNIIRDTLEFAGTVVMGKAKEYSPIDRGILRGSITRGNVYKNSNGYEIKVGTNVKYAPYQEYGTGIFAGRGYIYPKRSRFLVWTDRKSGKLIFAKRVKGIKGRFYFKKAKEFFIANIDKIKLKLSNIFKIYVK